MSICFSKGKKRRPQEAAYSRYSGPLWLGPNSTRSGIIRADENKMVTGPNLNSRLDSLPGAEIATMLPLLPMTSAE